jgi:hypothetical protein
VSACHVRLNARVVHGPFTPKWPCPIIPRLRSSEAWMLVLATYVDINARAIEDPQVYGALGGIRSPPDSLHMGRRWRWVELA